MPVYTAHSHKDGIFISARDITKSKYEDTHLVNLPHIVSGGAKQATAQTLISMPA